MRTQLLIAVLFTALLAPAAQALTIDNFEEGDFSVVDNSPPLGVATLGEQSGLLGTNTIGGVRLVRSLSEGVGTATAALTTTGGDDGVSFSAVVEGNYALIYDGIAGGNANSGSAGTLNLDLSTTASIDVLVSTPMPTGADMRITLYDGLISRSTAFRPIVNGVNSFELTGGLTLLNLADIKTILIAIEQVGPTTGMSISDISTVPVPEPTTALLLTLGLAGLAVSRKR